jgi:hypothetical protein
MTWREAYLKQAWSDFKIYQHLNANEQAFCHQLHYLQMTTEKLAKGFQCPIAGGPYHKTHVVFVDFLQRLKKQPSLYYSRMQFKSMNQFTSHIQSLMPIAGLIENLVPGNYNKMNPEYPWSDLTNNVYCPVSYGFPEFRRRERQLLIIQNFLTNLFRLEGYQ